MNRSAHPPLNPPVCSVRDLTVHLGGTRVLRGVSFAVLSGEWVTLIGPNGAGKTTVLRAISGLVPCDGTVTLWGTPVAAMSRRERARRIAYVPQVPTIPPGMSVLEYVLLGRTPYIAPLGRESETDLRVARDALDRVDLAGYAKRMLGTLSGGERQRAVLARAFAQQSALVLLDEPTAALDIGHQQDVLELVDSLRRTDGLTVISTMHDLTAVGEYADRLLLLAGGDVAAEGIPDEVLTQANLERFYGARVRVIRLDPDGRGPVVVPIRDGD